jgi:hypothetical protein
MVTTEPLTLRPTPYGMQGTKGYGLFCSRVVGRTSKADWDLQRQWKDIKQKYIQPAVEEGGDDADDDDE